MKTLSFAALAGVLLFPAAPVIADDDAAPTRDCFRTRSVSGYTVVDNETIRLTLTRSRVYEIEVSRAGCFGLRHSHSIAVSSGRGSGSICVGDGPFAGRVVTDDGDRCRILEVRRFDPEAETETEADAETGETSAE